MQENKFILQEMNGILNSMNILKNTIDFQIQQLQGKIEQIEDSENSNTYMKNATSATVMIDVKGTKPISIPAQDYVHKSNLTRQQLNSMELMSLYAVGALRDVSYQEMIQERNSRFYDGGLLKANPTQASAPMSVANSQNVVGKMMEKIKDPKPVTPVREGMSDIKCSPIDIVQRDIIESNYDRPEFEDLSIDVRGIKNISEKIMSAIDANSTSGRVKKTDNIHVTKITPDEALAAYNTRIKKVEAAKKQKEERVEKIKKDTPKKKSTSKPKTKNSSTPVVAYKSQSKKGK